MPFHTKCLTEWLLSLICTFKNSSNFCKMYSMSINRTVQSNLNYHTVLFTVTWNIEDLQPFFSCCKVVYLACVLYESNWYPVIMPPDPTGIWSHTVIYNPRCGEFEPQWKLDWRILNLIGPFEFIYVWQNLHVGTAGLGHLVAEGWGIWQLRMKWVYLGINLIWKLEQFISRYCM